MEKLLNKVENVKKVFLHGCNDYEEFLLLLKNTNVPTTNFETFVDYMVNQFYISEDFYSILILIKNNLSKYESYTAENIVFRDILEVIMQDYVDFINLTL